MVTEYLRKKFGVKKQVSEIFGITERSVNKIWAQYKKGGKRGPGKQEAGRPGREETQERPSLQGKTAHQGKTSRAIEASLWPLGQRVTPTKPLYSNNPMLRSGFK
ncbi:hypothetical protein [Mariniflexile sp.]|uniref:hypothetical protein n=1 Tax=Mariniflexile sp. TaxID=1979402 RepID=UPI004047B2AF